MLRSVIACVLAASLAVPPPAIGAAQERAAAPTADLAALLARVDIPYATFTLANGLRVVVHEDRKAPVVAVSIWYNVGSKDEPAGRTGFAHLFEHLMFNGSENAPGDYFAHTAEMGATNLNGTTWFDRTNYYQTVPTGALERALFLESDRMGHLLGAVTQENLTNQIGVVQNEKRQADTRAFGLVSYAQLADLFPEGHPYRHSTIGSMADLSAATLDDVRQWFRDNYGPNNAVLVLAGDIDAARARPLVERWFGHIPRGPVNRPAEAAVPTLRQRVDRLMHDRVPVTRLYRSWVVPGLTDPEVVPLSVGATVLGGLASSRLDNLLVRGERSAVRVSANVQQFHRVSLFDVEVDVRPGEDPAAVGRRLDAIIAQFVREGPTDDEVRRTVMSAVSSRIQGLELANGKAVALAEGMLYADDPAFYRRRLAALAATTPAQVRAALQRWLSRPVYALTVAPGAREDYAEPPAAPAAAARAAAPIARGGARERPPIAESPTLDFPALERARLSNGIEIVYARRDAVPVTRIAVEFDAGTGADAPGRAGIQALMLGLLEEGTTRRDSIALAEAQERLGARIDSDAGRDRTNISLTALTANLGLSLDLLAEIIRQPAFALAEVERLRTQQLAAAATARTRPDLRAGEAMLPLLYGDHPYGRSPLGDEAAVRAATRDDLVAFHQAWIRPDNARIFAVGDLPLAQLLPQLETRFGDWRAPAAPRGTKAMDAALPRPTPRIVLIDRPQSPQSYILGGQVLPAEGRSDLLAFEAANEVLAGDFLARINMDLRERRGWSYGARGGPASVAGPVPYMLSAPVQADRTGDSIAAMIEQVRAFLGPNGVQPAELNRVVLGNTRELPGRFQTSSAVLGAMLSNALLGRPDDYWETIAARYRALVTGQLDQAARRLIDPARFVWVVVGDAARVRPQLDRLGLPVEVRPAS